MFEAQLETFFSAMMAILGIALVVIAFSVGAAIRKRLSQKAR